MFFYFEKLHSRYIEWEINIYNTKITKKIEVYAIPDIDIWGIWNDEIAGENTPTIYNAVRLAENTDELIGKERISYLWPDETDNFYFAFFNLDMIEDTDIDFKFRVFSNNVNRINIAFNVLLLTFGFVALSFTLVMSFFNLYKEKDAEDKITKLEKRISEIEAKPKKISKGKKDK